MLVIFAILAILMTLLSANLNKLTQVSRLNQCKSQLKNIFVAMELYINDNDNYLPGPLYGGQVARIGRYNLAGFFSPYLEITTAPTGHEYSQNFVCPSNFSKDSVYPDYLRLHFRTHFSPGSMAYFGYPRSRESSTVNSIPNPSNYGFLRGFSKLEFEGKTKPGWYTLLSDLPPHFNTDVNVLSMDGHIDSTRQELP